MARFPFFVLLLVSASSSLLAEIDYQTLENLPYREIDDSYAQERCFLDLYAPTNATGYATIVWFHGGGLKNGEKHIPERFKNQGIAVVAPNYRLYPKISNPTHIADSAAAVAWVFENIAKHGGDPNKIFVSGHSAGGYLASMIGLDKRWLAEHGIDANDIAGLIPYDGHGITHATIREEMGIPETRPIIDEYAPLYHVRSDAPPILLLTGDRALDLPGRYAENAYLYTMLKAVNHPDVTLYEFNGYGHSMTEPGHPLALAFVSRIIEDE